MHTFFRNHSKIEFLILIFFLFLSCKSLVLNGVRGAGLDNSPNGTKKDSEVVPDSSPCKFVLKQTQWYLLFGSFPINRVESAQILPDSNQVYKVTLKTSWLDGLLSVVLGIAASVTRKTIEVESCDGKEFTPTKNLSLPIEKSEAKIENPKWKEEFLKQNEKQWKDEVQERFLSEKEEEVESVWKKEIKNSKNLSVLFLKSGEIVKGKVTRIDGDGVKLFFKGQEKSFKRADVLKVRFQD
nr:Bor family protein [Leptospira ainazelensis]